MNINASNQLNPRNVKHTNVLSNFPGTIHIDANGDRLADFQLFQFKSDVGQLVLVKQFDGQKRSIQPVEGQQIFWKYGEKLLSKVFVNNTGVQKSNLLPGYDSG